MRRPRRLDSSAFRSALRGALVDDHRQLVAAEPQEHVVERVEHGARGDPVGGVDDHRLVGALEREASQWLGEPGAEVEQNDVVEAAEELSSRPYISGVISSIASGRWGAASRCSPVGVVDIYGSRSDAERMWSIWAVTSVSWCSER
jgi:hypothetical protein